ncbi:BPTI/Kunitz domain-containing protein-like [Drosophila miranda]|uniref:BPTI/Kunitz domain-containing protein-like n=1 Tax=Drosophila miranda TaxID=7229 RepID=UPI00143F45C0|nr:BPTI/Kunitz domain-containing protein-like [Drosophila miranda]
MELAKDICVQQPDSGPCRGSYHRYAFNPHTHRCDAFSYGGCRGNRNNFLTENDCLHTCSMTGSASSTAHQDGNLPKGCIMSEWENWSACSVSCGLGFSEAHRFVISEPKHGGQSCPKRLVKHRRQLLNIRLHRDSNKHNYIFSPIFY